MTTQRLAQSHRRIATLVLWVATGLAGIPSAYCASYSFTTIDFPGAIDSGAMGINDAGNIVGAYFDSTGEHGFLDAGGSFTSINVAGSTFTIADGIAAGGQIVGIYGATTTQVPATFFTGTYLGVAVLGATQQLNPFNLAESITVGSVGLCNSTVCPGSNGGFLDVGNFAANPPSFGTLSQFAVEPLAARLVGVYTDITGTAHGFLETVSYTGGDPDAVSSYTSTYSTLDFPGAIATAAVGLNDLGQIVGIYEDSHDVMHGFVADPTTAVPVPGGLSLLATGLTALAAFRKRRQTTLTAGASGSPAETSAMTHSATTAPDLQ